ncbi:hypothetical protein K2X33_15070 [bacterium]|nr:hypothetical protein [bacterium]
MRVLGILGLWSSLASACIANLVAMGGQPSELTLYIEESDEAARLAAGIAARGAAELFHATRFMAEPDPELQRGPAGLPVITRIQVNLVKHEAGEFHFGVTLQKAAIIQQVSLPRSYPYHLTPVIVRGGQVLPLEGVKFEKLPLPPMGCPADPSFGGP